MCRTSCGRERQTSAHAISSGSANGCTGRARTRSKSARWAGGAAFTASASARTQEAAAWGKTVRNEPGAAAGGRSSNSSGLVLSACSKRSDHADMAADLHSGLEAMQRADAAEVRAASRWDKASRQASSEACGSVSWQCGPLGGRRVMLWLVCAFLWFGLLARLQFEEKTAIRLLSCRGVGRSTGHAVNGRLYIRRRHAQDLQG